MGSWLKLCFLELHGIYALGNFPGSFIFRFYRSFEVSMETAPEEKKSTPTLLVLFI